MTEAEIALAREAVECKHWEWMEGMFFPELRGGKGWNAWVRPSGRVGERRLAPRDALPDFSDPATVGCLLALVRKAWRDPSVYVAPCTELHADGTSPVWFVYTGRGRGPIGTGPTEAAALVAALKAAP